MKKRWVFKEKGEEAVVQRLAKELSIEDKLANLLVQREIYSYDEAKSFFRPQLDDLLDPFLMHDMDKAVERITAAVEMGEKILVYGDYDVDGTTAVALVYTFLHQFYHDIDFYIPDRDAEGYGISYKGIDYAAENNYSLMIILDCGIKAIEKTKYATEKNVDFIICDHHRPGDEIPPAYAVLDPKRNDCPYPFKELSGCGVGFKLAQAYAQKHDLPFEDLIPFLDLVVVSIASDIVPINGENRVLAHFGLKQLNKNPRPGIEAILEMGNVKRVSQPRNEYVFSKELGISDLVFMVGPRINAAGRIESARNSVRLLVEKDYSEALKIATKINTLNNERKNFDLNATTEALSMISESEEMSNASYTVVYDPDWHKGVVGIVASRLTETYYRPTIVLTYSNGLITGSARSVKDFDIYDAIDACNDLLEHFGGHKYAAGLSLKEENLESFTKRFGDYVNKNITKEQLVPEIEIASELYLRDISSRFFRILRQFAPFGPGNLSPIFYTPGLVDTGKAKIVGKNHLKLEVVNLDISGFPFSAIAFQQGNHFADIKEGKQFLACYHIEENEWNGIKTIQLNIKDIRIED